MDYRPFTRTAARIYSATSYSALVGAAVAGVGLLRKALPTRLYPVDSLELFTQDAAQPAPAAASFDKGANVTIAPTEYVFGNGQTLLMQAIGASTFVADLPASTQVDGPQTPEAFVERVLTDAVAMGIEDLLVNANNVPPQPQGLLAGTFPRSSSATVTTNVDTRVSSLFSAALGLRSGGGATRAGVLSGHPRVLAQLLIDLVKFGGGDALIDQGAVIPNTSHRTWGVLLPNVGVVPVVPSSFFPLISTAGSLMLLDTSGESGVHIAVPKGQPDLVISSREVPGSSGRLVSGSFAYTLAGLDDTKAIELTGYPAL